MQNRQSVVAGRPATGFPAEKIFVDTELRTYKVFGLVRAKDFSEIQGKKKNVDTKSSNCGGMCWSICQFCKVGKQGDVYQLGGSFLVGPGRQFHWSQTDGSSQDHITAQQVKEMLDL